MSIDTPQAVKWSNEKCRPIANLVMQLDNAITLMSDEWSGQNLAQYFPDGGGDIEDRAQEDGRPINTRDNVINMSGNILQIQEAISPFIGSSQKISNLPIRG